MCCAAQIPMNRRQTKKQAIAIALLVCFTVLSLLSGAFVLTHADHDHDHNGPHGTCTACAGLQNAESIIKLLATAVTGGFAVAVWLYTYAAIIRAVYASIALLTPIAAKTRMNN